MVDFSQEKANFRRYRMRYHDETSSVMGSILSDLLRAEIHFTLQHYWKNAYGYPITSFQSCPLSKDIFYHLDLAVIGRTMMRE
jgi:hypothetical protein